MDVYKCANKDQIYDVTFKIAAIRFNEELDGKFETDNLNVLVKFADKSVKISAGDVGRERNTERDFGLLRRSSRDLRRFRGKLEKSLKRTSNIFSGSSFKIRESQMRSNQNSDSDNKAAYELLTADATHKRDDEVKRTDEILHQINSALNVQEKKEPEVFNDFLGKSNETFGKKRTRFQGILSKIPFMNIFRKSEKVAKSTGTGLKNLCRNDCECQCHQCVTAKSSQNFPSKFLEASTSSEAVKSTKVSKSSEASKSSEKSFAQILVSPSPKYSKQKLNLGTSDSTLSSSPTESLVSKNRNLNIIKKRSKFFGSATVTFHGSSRRMCEKLTNHCIKYEICSGCDLIATSSQMMNECFAYNVRTKKFTGDIVNMELILMTPQNKECGTMETCVIIRKA